MRRCCAYEFCARDFTPRHRDQIYCCAACNKRRYAQRHKAKVLRMHLAQRSGRHDGPHDGSASTAGTWRSGGG